MSSMQQWVVTAGTTLWNMTKSRRLKELYLSCFLALVRGRRVVTEVEGMVFDLDLGEMIDACLYLRRFEPDIVAIIERCCQPGWTVIDIGANIGAHTIRFAKKVQPNGRVIAFEPTEFAFRKLQRNLSLNPFGNVEAHRIALSDRALDAQTIDFRSSWHSDGGATSSVCVVDFRRLDDWVAQHPLAGLDLIKLDVDGNEFPILVGGRETLERFRPIVLIEVGAYHFEDPARNPVRLLEDLGYHFWDSKTLLPYGELESIKKRLPDHDPEKSFSLNVVAAIEFPAGHAASARRTDG